MNTRFLLLAALVTLLASPKLSAQLSFGFSHEVGVITGPVAFQSDYGLRNDFDTNRGNVGIGVGIVHYINFSYRADCNCYTRDTYFNDHFKIRNEIDWHRTKLEHLGELAEVDSDQGRDLRDHDGVANVFEIGTQLEYFPLSIREFTATLYSFAPYVSLGAHFVSFNPEATSSQGPLGTPETTFDDFLIGDGRLGGIDDSSGTTFAITFSAGTRYKLSPLSDLLLDLRWHYYDSNWVDGLNPDPEFYPPNKYNDWIFWINVGYIYYLDF
ncbi:THC0290_0291 family protein [Croceiramulus getboli]|nr:outer membrane beta-barrel protein [Flavobacteriaceae bacterium YJPT1-3]